MSGQEDACPRTRRQCTRRLGVGATQAHRHTNTEGPTTGNAIAPEPFAARTHTRGKAVPTKLSEPLFSECRDRLRPPSGNETQPRFPSVHAGERGGRKPRLRRRTRPNRREARPPQTNKRPVRRPLGETETVLPAPKKRETKEKAHTGGRGVRGAVSARHRRCGQLAAKKEENRRGLGALPRAPSTKSAEEEEGEKGQWEGPMQAGVAESRRFRGTPGGSPLTS